MSYSTRIGWPGLAEYDPRLRFSDPATTSMGNPRLRPELTRAYELKLMATLGRHQADLTSYYQLTRDLRSSLVELAGEVLIARPVNLGTRRAIGANLLLRGPLAKGLSYTVNANLALEKIGGTGGGPGADGGLDHHSTAYGGSAQIEYRDGDEGRAGADTIRLTAGYSGPADTGLVRTSPTASVSAFWSHAITDRLSAVLTASHVLGSNRTRYFGEDVVSRTSSRADGPRVTLALTRGLGPSPR